MPPAYELRSGGDGRRTRQNLAELKLRRLAEVNIRLKEDLDRPRIKVAEASISTLWCRLYGDRSTNVMTLMRHSSLEGAVY
ncbi:guanine nucleotide-binding protein subunit gamma [Trichophyton equinum CBS 127.97]|uniref:Guanine nucleotide-binding protein subunit gamma n=1 Tax=Trichophyton equinum (strain ATCC MYA-4606 / CBS 127.97) TaxID=559882 RepID=F2PTQ3_TRIEC|nr:guanine nucleotide-binding protein subunit gamma [Trichophyton equinum CBS 127.97]